MVEVAKKSWFRTASEGDDEAMRLLVGFALSAVMGSASGWSQTVEVVETHADGSALLAHAQTNFAPDAPPVVGAVTLDVQADKTLQRMEGFGASMTESSAAVILGLPKQQRDGVMRELFSRSGPLGLTLLRQPIGASDFSAQGDYSYDDTPDGKPDPALAHFSVAKDEADVFPLLREALSLNLELRILVLPWSSPAWMKTTRTMKGGRLEDKFVAVYAQYLAQTVEAYAKQGLPVLAMSLQNEPLNENASYPTQLMDPKQEIALAQAVRPLLRDAGRTTLLLGYEHNWGNREYPAQLLTDTAGKKPPVFDGISFHCYAGNAAAEQSLLLAHPETTVWFTECSGVSRNAFAQDLMWQARHLLLEAPLNGAKSVLLWNLALDPNGRPHNGGCDGCRGLLTIAKHDGVATVTRNVEYYVLGQVAPFVHPGAMQVEVTSAPEQGVLANGYRNPDGTMVVVALNSSPKDVTVAVKSTGSTASYKMAARSMATFRWGTPKRVMAAGAYRLAVTSGSGICLEAEATVAEANCSAAPEQLWTVTAVSGGRVEVRNVGTAQLLTTDAAGKFALLKVDGDHTAPLSVETYAEEVCLGAATGRSCGAGAELRFLPPAMPVITDKSSK